MRIAIPIWLERVSPVFDVAGRVLVVDVQEGRETSRQEASLAEASPAERARQLADLGVQHLICGGISAEMEAALGDLEIVITPYICGSVGEVLQAYLQGSMGRQFAMPGCCGRRRRVQGQGRCRRGRPWANHGRSMT